MLPTLKHSIESRCICAQDDFKPKENVADTILFASITVFLVLIAGLMSGLTLGLLSISKTDLEVRDFLPCYYLLYFLSPITLGPWKPPIALLMLGIKVLRRPHFLLVTLVLCNAAATEALPIFLDRLLNPFAAILLSITVVLIFGEIIPQSICSRYGLAVGAYSAYFVRALMILCGVVAYPISKILDWVLGPEQEAVFRRTQFKALVSIHSQAEGLGGNLSSDEISVIQGALDLGSKPASACMTPLDKVFMLSSQQALDEQTMLQILESGHSRIPIHKPDRRDEIVGLLLVKELIIVDKNLGLRAGDVRLRGLPYLQADTNLYEILHLFESGRCHMAVLTSSPEEAFTPDEQLEEVLHVRIENETVEAEPLLQRQPSLNDDVEHSASTSKVVGVLTIEDIIEELLQTEIVDETDRFVDNEGLERVNAGVLLRQLPPHLRRLLRSRQFLPRVGPQLGVPSSLVARASPAIEEARARVKSETEGLHRISGRARPSTPARFRMTSKSGDGSRSSNASVAAVDSSALQDLQTPFLAPR